MADHALATIDNPSSALTDFTLLVDLSNMPSSWWAAVDTSDGTRGRVYKGDGTTRLSCDWINFNNVAETGILAVKWSGALAASGTQQLWIEPPLSTNAAVAASDTYGADNAYDSYYAGFWIDGGITDRTANGNDGTAQGGASAGGGSGVLGSATDFDGTDDFINVPDDDSLSLNSVNGNSWFLAYRSPASFTGLGTRAIFSKYPTVSPFTGEWFLSITENNEIGGANHGAFIQLLDASATTRYRCETNVALTLDAWNTVGWAWDGVTGAVGHMVGALNGNSVALTENENDFNSIYNRAGYVAIGAGLTGTTYDTYTDGLAQCFSFHSTARSVAWFAHMDSQVRDNSNFYTAWAWSGGGGGESPVANIMQSMDQFAGGM